MLVYLCERMKIPVLAILFLMCLTLQGQNNLDSTRKGYVRGKAGLMLKRGFDMANTPGNGHYRQADKNTEKLRLPEEAAGFVPVFSDDFDSLNTQIWQIGHTDFVKTTHPV